jgi:hypothetical protein
VAASIPCTEPATTPWAREASASSSPRWAASCSR